MNNTTLRRFEQGTAMPREINRILISYAYLGGFEDQRALIAEALRAWWDEGDVEDAPQELRQFLTFLGFQPKQRAAD